MHSLLRYSIDSWVEISSQPSTSSLSSIATNDEIITTGLRVQHLGSNSHHRPSRRRRLERLAAVTTAQVSYSSREPSIASSSQDEYEESDSESDRVLTSSNEDLGRQSVKSPRFIRAGSSPALVDDFSDDEDDDATALGMRQISSSPFVPQPNAFSHPPASRDPSWTSPMEPRRSEPSVVSNSSRVTAIRANTNAGPGSSRRRQQHSPYNMLSPSHQADHDAALRASLSTLLSCAAAARGLQKQDPPPVTSVSRAPPSSFRLVPESVAMGEESSGGEDAPTSAAVASRQHPRKQPKPVAAQTPSHTSSKAKRRSSASSKDRSSSHPSSSRKSRRANLTDSGTATSPTLMTWVISAGVVVIFSAISFSAGYMLGREVARTEMAMGDGGVRSFSGTRASTGCGQEAVKGSLKRLRWGGGGSGSVIIA